MVQGCRSEGGRGMSGGRRAEAVLAEQGVG